MVGTITNWGTAVLTSLSNALALVFSFVPKLIGFLVILLVGWIVASALSRAVTFLLRKIGFDRVATRIGLTNLEQRMGLNMDAAGLLGKVVYWFVFLVFLVPAVDALGLTTVSNILNTIIAYIPNVFVAIIVLFLGTLAATFVADVVRGAMSSARVGNPNLFANIARYAIIGFVALIALEQLQIAPALLNILFTAIVGAAALALGLAFGLGGRETAQRLLNRSETTVSNAAQQMSAQQSINQARNVAQTQSNAYTANQYPSNMKADTYPTNQYPASTPTDGYGNNPYPQQNNPYPQQ